VEYPCLVFRSPGQYSGEFGATYTYRQVQDAAEHARALEAGWHSSAEQAVAAAGEAAYTHNLRGKKLTQVMRAKPWERHQKAAQAVFAAQPVSAPAEDVSQPPEPVDDAPPTREELEQKARELGIRFDGRTSDKRLLARIEAALKEPV
jgi:hypothetical protein